MSTLKADTIQSTSGGAATLTKQQAAKIWINLNGTGTIATRDSFNVSSIADTNTGTYTINHASAMSNNDYCAALMGRMDRGTSNSGAANGINSSDGSSSVATSSHVLSYINVGTTGDADVPIGGSMVMGDLA